MGTRGLRGGGPSASEPVQVVARVAFDGTVLHVATCDPELLFVTADRAVGRRLEAFLPSALAADLRQGLAAVRRTGTCKSVAFDLVVPKGRRSFDAQIVPFGANEALILSRDVTEEEDAPSPLSPRARPAESATSALPMGASAPPGGGRHELLNALAIVVGHASLLEEQLASEPDRRLLAREILQAGHEATALVRREHGDARGLAPNDGFDEGADRDAARKCVLVVDDDEAVRRTVCLALGAAGHDVHEANGADEALAMAQSMAFDVVFTDVHMRGGSGHDLARRLHLAQPELRIVFLTGDPLGVAPGSGPGMVLQKPVAPAELVRAVRGARAARRSRWSIGG